jgi:hypothetical protein
MRVLLCTLALAVLVRGQQPLPPIEGETLSGRKISLPAALEGKPAVLIIGFTRGSQTQTKAWSQRLRDQFPAWSLAVLEDVPGLVRGIVARSIRKATPKEQHGHFVLIYRGENELKRAAGFARPDDAYILVIDASGAVHWSFRGPVTESAVEQVRQQIPGR